jgi:hypothetical protein
MVSLSWTTQPLPPYESRCLLCGLEVLSDSLLFVRDSLCVRIESAYLADFKITLVRVEITLERVKIKVCVLKSHPDVCSEKLSVSEQKFI